MPLPAAAKNIVEKKEDEGLAPVKNLDLILAELDRDPTGIYWG